MPGVGRRSALVVVLLVWLQAVDQQVEGRLHDLIGWSESYKGGKQKDEHQHDGTLWVESLSWEPRAYLYHNFLSEEECDHLIALGKPSMTKSTVVDSVTGKPMSSTVRTSSGMFLNRGQDPTVKAIEQRIAMYSQIPASQGEGMQILHYEKTEKYESHYDYFHDEVNKQNGGQRVATMLMYLSDVEEGGETVFPNSSEKPTKGDPHFSECAQRGVAVKPRKGDALLFYSLTLAGGMDPSSLHGGCPVISGDKWSATKWMRVHEYAAP
ncbi:hypothetical protein WJX72_009156 [[Myrmecia] bisecta]|uniref:procollagen-proline 4-dioxygenase n=1 Tax=[Myrmecia] bisecta TaxID=41462 RepID=A0AAW1QG97_9CHLO